MCSAKVVAPETFRDYRTQSIVVNVIAITSVLFVFDTVLYEVHVKFRFRMFLQEDTRYLYLDISRTFVAPLGVEPCGTCVNCMAITSGSSPDVVEIDGASNNSVDEVRQLKSQVPLVPFASKYKVYIIDEVHMLSTAAFNALRREIGRASCRERV